MSFCYGGYGGDVGISCVIANGEGCPMLPEMVVGYRRYNEMVALGGFGRNRLLSGMRRSGCCV